MTSFDTDVDLQVEARSSIASGVPSASLGGTSPSSFETVGEGVMISMLETDGAAVIVIANGAGVGVSVSIVELVISVPAGVEGSMILLGAHVGFW
jgi:hypothetical protein